MWPSSWLTCAWLNTYLPSPVTAFNAHQICTMFPPPWHERPWQTCAPFFICAVFPSGSGARWLRQRKALIYSTLYCTVAANCSLNLLPPLVWYSKGLVYPVVLLELSQGYYSLPKGVFMPLLNCGSPSVGLALHWYWATTNYQLITQQKVHRFHWFKVITRQPTDLWGKTLRVVMLLRGTVVCNVSSYWYSLKVWMIFLMAGNAGNKLILFLYGIWTLTGLDMG